VKLSAARKQGAEKLNKAVNAELAPLKLERAKFMTQVDSDAQSPGPQGIDKRRVLGADQSGHASWSA
jgi:DNA repair protein RecN (Recombination protein N)